MLHKNKNKYGFETTPLSANIDKTTAFIKGIGSIINLGGTAPINVKDIYQPLKRFKNQKGFYKSPFTSKETDSDPLRTDFKRIASDFSNTMREIEKYHIK